EPVRSSSTRHAAPSLMRQSSLERSGRAASHMPRLMYLTASRLARITRWRGSRTSPSHRTRRGNRSPPAGGCCSLHWRGPPRLPAGGPRASRSPNELEWSLPELAMSLRGLGGARAPDTYFAAISARLGAPFGQLSPCSDDEIVPSLGKTLCWEGECAADVRGCAVGVEAACGLGARGMGFSCGAALRSGVRLGAWWPSAPAP